MKCIEKKVEDAQHHKDHLHTYVKSNYRISELVFDADETANGIMEILDVPKCQKDPFREILRAVADCPEVRLVESGVALHDYVKVSTDWSTCFGGKDPEIRKVRMTEIRTRVVFVHDNGWMCTVVLFSRENPTFDLEKNTTSDSKNGSWRKHWRLNGYKSGDFYDQIRSVVRYMAADGAL